MRFKECPQRISSGMSGVNYSSTCTKDLVPEQYPVWCKWIHFDYTLGNHTPHNPLYMLHSCYWLPQSQPSSHSVCAAFSGVWWHILSGCWVCHWVPLVQDILKIVRAGGCPCNYSGALAAQATLGLHGFDTFWFRTNTNCSTHECSWHYHCHSHCSSGNM